jgi:hypothetical protein
MRRSIILRIALIAAILMTGGFRGRGRWVSPAWEAYLAALSRGSPTLYRLLSKEDPAEVLCGARMEWRSDESSLLPAQRTSLVPPAVILALFAVPLMLSESPVRQAFRPLSLGPVSPVHVPPPRAFFLR